ncbi:hypothetical protein CWATWH0003_5366 [Crocosphaera watsonii WH 0003]|uniref:Uncharacterized protein n=1 Tax=Crocosphaera watsonii WH 0003 TaxID=423471 RepID=G5JD68_CROWT|nr:hypothetical protein CWATWH0003_5366 [Crocosphaera watsonii WH 0003]
MGEQFLSSEKESLIYRGYGSLFLLFGAVQHGGLLHPEAITNSFLSL